MNIFSRKVAPPKQAATPLVRLDRRVIAALREKLPAVSRPSDFGEASFMLGIQYVLDKLERGWADTGEV